MKPVPGGIALLTRLPGSALKHPDPAARKISDHATTGVGGRLMGGLLLSRHVRCAHTPRGACLNRRGASGTIRRSNRTGKRSAQVTTVMLLQTNSYIVPKDKRTEHARLILRFKQTLARLGCDHFEAYEQVGANWSPTEATGRFVQIMRFRDRKHQQQVQAAERSDAGAQALIKEFCELINFPYQQQQGLFAVGFYTSILPGAMPRVPPPPPQQQSVQSQPPMPPAAHEPSDNGPIGVPEGASSCEEPATPVSERV